MKYLWGLILLLPVLLSCADPEVKQTSEDGFTVARTELPMDTTIGAIAYLDGHLLLLLDNGKLAVLDSSFNRETGIEKRLSAVDAGWLFSYNDTVFVGKKEKTYYLNSNFEPVEYKIKRTIYGRVLLEDSSYLVYGCCAGEFGGSIFFRDKRTSRTYSYFATCASQVLRFRGEYVVCNNLAHMSDHMSFLFVKDPRTLYEITDEKLKNHCNWYVNVDSLQHYWLKSKVGDVRVYESWDVMSLLTFPYKDSLFSILAEPKATVLAAHRGDTTITVDTLLKERIAFHEMQVIEAGKKRICLYKLTGGSPFAAYQTRGDRTGLIAVEGKRIEFFERKSLK